MGVQLSVEAMGFMPLIMALVSVSKTWIDSKWSPLLALGLSLLTSFFLLPGGDVAGNILEGVLLSLTASGLYSAGKVTGKAVLGVE